MGRELDERTREVTELIAGISSCEKALEVGSTFQEIRRSCL